MPSFDPEYNDSVFINCPFDEEYRLLFEALVFAVYDCGFVARCSLEVEDSSRPRIDRICELIRACRLGIHDISRTELDTANGLPRFNMPLELGLFLGAVRFGTGAQKHKRCLILDKEKFRYQRYCSDIAGQDVVPHEGSPWLAIKAVRDWLASASRSVVLPSGPKIAERFFSFREDLPVYCEVFRLEPEGLAFHDFTKIVVGWLRTKVQ